jgi:metal-responsive CopG/Arc/MetJ family transcriptional regulator
MFESCRSDGITAGMKIAVSIPDELFAEAEQLAERLSTSRSSMYARALAAFIGQYAPDKVTSRMNAVVDRVGEVSDPFTDAASRGALRRTEW